MLLVCDFCGKEYKTYRGIRCKHHYCSKDCTYKARNSFEPYVCDNCGKTVMKRHSQACKLAHHFCSCECLTQWQGRNKAEFICKTCGKKFYRSPSWTKQRKGYYCSIYCRNKDEQWIKKACIGGNLIQCKRRGLNKLELSGNRILDSLKLTYSTQYLIADKFLVDVYIPEHNLIIQWDGDYWHGKDKPYEELDSRVKKRVNLDKSQDNYFKKCGFNELRFWETDVYSREDYVRETIDEEIKRISVIANQNHRKRLI